MKAQSASEFGTIGREKVATLLPKEKNHSTFFNPETITLQGLAEDARFSTILIRDSLLKAVSLSASTFYIEAEENLIRLRFRVGSELTEELITENREFDATPFIQLAARREVENPGEKTEIVIRASVKKSTYELSLYVLTDFNGYRNLTVNLVKSPRFAPTLDELEVPSRTLHNIRDSLVTGTGLILLCSEDLHDVAMTRHAILQHLNTPKRKILSIESKQRHNLPRVTQICLSENPHHINCQASGLLKHSADVICLDETHESMLLDQITDTAPDSTCIIGTIKAKNAVFGLKKFLQTSSSTVRLSHKIEGILTQQSLLKACPNCKSVRKISERETQWIKGNFPGYDISENCFVEGEGCEDCNYTGFAGNRILYEYIAMDEEMRDAVADANLSAFATALALRDQFEPLKLKALKYALSGDIPFSQILRVN